MPLIILVTTPCVRVKVVLATHDPEEAELLSTRLVELEGGEVKHDRSLHAALAENEFKYDLEVCRGWR